MKANYTLQLTLFVSVTLFSLICGLNWIHALIIGFGASFLPIVPGALVSGRRAGKKEWYDPKCKK